MRFIVPPARPSARPTSGVLVGAVVAVIGFATAAILLVGDSNAATQRIALLFALIGTVVPVLLASLRSDQAASQTNGTLDQRVHDAVLIAMSNRAAETPHERATDPLVPAILPVDLPAKP